MSSLGRFSGTPTAAGTGTASVTARDRDGDTDSLSFAWTVAADLKPAFAAATLTKRDWIEGQTINAFAASPTTARSLLLWYEKLCCASNPACGANNSGGPRIAARKQCIARGDDDWRFMGGPTIAPGK